MNLKWIHLAADVLNTKALSGWNEIFSGLDAWMQAVLFGLFALLLGACLLECLWGLHMKRFARFIAGFTITFFPVFLILVMTYETEPVKALLYALGGAAAGGFLNAFLVRIFAFAEGFVLGTVVLDWALPEFFHMDPRKGNGRIWLLVISLILGVLFALFAKKLAFVITAVIGGSILGLVLGILIPYEKVPFLSEKLNLPQEQFRKWLPAVLSGAGVLIQFLQWLGAWRKAKALAVPAGEEDDAGTPNHWEKDEEKTEDAADTAEEVPEEVVSFAQAEEVLVEKAHELAQAAARSAETERIRERCRDVAEGLYAPEVGAEKLGLTPEVFREQMKRFGFLQEEAAEPEPAAEPEQTAESETEGSEPAAESEQAAEPEPDEPGQPGSDGGEEPSAENGEGTTDSGQAAEA